MPFFKRKNFVGFRGKIKWQEILISTILGLIISHIQSSWILWRLRNNAMEKEPN